MTSALTMPTDIQGITRSSVADTYAFIEEDFKYAIAHLPKKAEYASEDLGRATSGAAKGFLAKVYLYQEKHEEAEALLQDLCCRGSYAGNTPEYELMKNFADVWSIDHNNNEESLFEIQTNSDLTYNLGNRLPVVVASRDDSGWSWGMPTSHLENAYIAAGDEIPLRYTTVHHGQPDVPGYPTSYDGDPSVITPVNPNAGTAHPTPLHPANTAP